MEKNLFSYRKKKKKEESIKTEEISTDAYEEKISKLTKDYGALLEENEKLREEN